MAEIIDEKNLESALKKIPEWASVGKGIERTFEFKNFVGAMEFVNSVASAAEEANHHPDIDIRWNKVRLHLVTHSAGGLTELDVALAQRVDCLI